MKDSALNKANHGRGKEEREGGKGGKGEGIHLREKCYILTLGRGKLKEPASPWT